MTTEELVARLALAGLPVDLVTLPHVNIGTLDDSNEALGALLVSAGLVDEPSGRSAVVAPPTQDFTFLATFIDRTEDFRETFRETKLVYGIKGSSDWGVDTLPCGLIVKFT